MRRQARGQCGPFTASLAALGVAHPLSGARVKQERPPRVSLPRPATRRYARRWRLIASVSTSPRRANPPAMDASALLLEQYKTVRQETLDALSQMQPINQWGLGSIGVTIGFGLVASQH